MEGTESNMPQRWPNPKAVIAGFHLSGVSGFVEIEKLMQVRAEWQDRVRFGRGFGDHQYSV